ncbi:MAG: hypothetical protein QF719_06745 [Chloroflexota bacterium]|jgi:hypothetical protein|nr:hypothetical protein [Chloroflexota bacterium]MDP6509269.1 hypothetical protein [Chloroflexota bacterium]MDP6757893.1 hypothetical protein [Chloroflexota bacterium]
MQRPTETDARVWRIAGLALAGLTVVAVILGIIAIGVMTGVWGS